MNQIFCFLSILISLIVIIQINAQPADPKPDPTKAAVNATKDAIADVSKALNSTKNALNPGDITKKGTSLIAPLVAACHDFINKILSLFSGSSAGSKAGTAAIPGLDIASQVMKTGGELITVPIKVGKTVAEDVLKILSPSSAKEPASNKTAAAAPKPTDIVSTATDIGTNMFTGILGAFGL